MQLIGHRRKPIVNSETAIEQRILGEGSTDGEDRIVIVRLGEMDFIFPGLACGHLGVEIGGTVLV